MSIGNYDIGELVAEIAIDTGEMRKGISDAKSQLSSLESGIITLNNSIESQTNAMSASFRGVENTLKLFSSSLGGINSAIRQTANATQSSLKSLTGDFNTFAVENLSALGRVETGFTNLTGVVRQSSVNMNSSMRTMENGIIHVMDAIIHQTSRADIGFNNMSRVLGRISDTGEAQLSGLDRGFRSLTNHIDHCVTELRELNNSMGRINTGNLSGINNGLSGITSGLKAGTQEAGNLFYSLSKVSLFAYIIAQDFQALGNAFKTIFGQGIGFAIEMENSMIGMSAIISSSFQKADGSAVSFYEGLTVAKDVIAQMKVEALSSTATLEELMGTFQAILGPASQLGLTMKEIKEFTVFGVNAVKSMGLKKDQMIQELRSIVSGNITARSSTVATALGITNTDIDNAKAQIGGVFAFLKERMAGFVQASRETEGTLSAIWSNIADGIQQTQEIAYEGIFDKMKEELKNVQELFFSIKRYEEDVYDQAGKRTHEKGDIQSSSLNPGTVLGFTALANIVSKVYDDIKGWGTELSNSASFVANFRDNLNGVLTLISSIYDHFKNIAGMFIIWNVATGSFKVAFIALALVADQFGNTMNFISNNIELMTALMLGFGTATKLAGVALTLTGVSAGGITKAVAGVIPLMGGIIGLGAILYTQFAGTDALLSLIKNNITEIGILFAGWKITTLVAGFGGMYGIIAGVVTIVVTLAQHFGVLNDLITIGVIALTAYSISLAYTAYTAGVAGLSIGTLTTIIAIQARVVGILVAVFEALQIAVSAVLVIAGALAAIIGIPLYSAVVIVTGALAGLGYLLGGKLADAFNWVKDKVIGFTSSLWDNTSATKENTKATYENILAKTQQDMLDRRARVATLGNAKALGPINPALYDEDGTLSEEDIENAERLKREAEQTKALEGLTNKFSSDSADKGAKGRASAERKRENLEEKIADQEADNIRKEALEKIKENLKENEVAYKEHLIGISQYFSERTRLEKENMAIETQAIQQKIANAQAHADEARAHGDTNTAIENDSEVRKLNSDLIVKQIQNTTKLIDITREQTKAYKDLDASLQSVHASYLNSQNQFGEGARIGFVNKNQADVDKYLPELNALRAKLALNKELDAGDATRLRRLEEFFIFTQNESRITIANGLIKEQELIIDKGLYESQLKKKNLEYDSSKGLITDLELKQKTYDADKEALAETEDATIRVIALKEALYNQTGDIKFKKDADALKQSLLDLQHPLTALQDTFQKTFKSGMEDVIENLITKTKSLSDSLKDFVTAMKQQVGKQIAQQLTGSIMESIFGKQKSNEDGLKELNAKVKQVVPTMNVLDEKVRLTSDALGILREHLLLVANTPVVPTAPSGIVTPVAGEGGSANTPLDTAVQDSTVAIADNAVAVKAGTQVVSKNATALGNLTTNTIAQFASSLALVSGKSGLGKFFGVLSMLNQMGVKLGGGKGFLGFSSGGFVSGKGTSTSDSIDAKLSDGEFVVRASAVRKFGRDHFDNLNQGRLPTARYADGGIVGRAPSETPTATMPANFKIEIINKSDTPLKATKTETKIDGVTTVMSLWLEGISNNVGNSQDLIKSIGGRK